MKQQHKFKCTKWYGSLKTRNTQFINHKNKIFLQKKLRSNFNNFVFPIYLTPFWNLIIFLKKNAKKKSVLIHSKTYYFSFGIPLIFADIKFFHDAQTLVLITRFQNIFYKKYYFLFTTIFLSFSKIFFRKLKFKGKGYYIYKTLRNTITVQMGYSHIIRLFAFKINVKFTAKTAILMFGLNTKNLLLSGTALKHFKPINIFTGRGIRFNRQIIHRKVGKISSYR